MMSKIREAAQEITYVQDVGWHYPDNLQKCKWRYHYAASPKLWEPRSAQEVEAKEDHDFISVLARDSDANWMIILKIVRRRVQFKIDIGAEVTAVSRSNYRGLDRMPLQKPSRSLPCKISRTTVNCSRTVRGEGVTWYTKTFSNQLFS